MQTCFNSFSAVSKATMPSYGAFCTEFYVKHPGTITDTLRVQNPTKKALFENLKKPRAKAHLQNKSEYLSRNPYKRGVRKKSYFFIFRIPR